MANHHYEKWITKTLTGVLLTGGGIFFMYYHLTHPAETLKEKWIYYALVSAVAITAGIVLLCIGFVHKVKSDLIRKTKMRNLSE